MGTNKPVKVMHFIHSLKGGGAERVLAYLINYSDPSKISHAVCCFNDDGREKLESRCEIIHLNRKHKYDFRFRDIYKHLLIWKPAIIHNWLPNVQVNSFISSRRYGKTIYVDSYHSAVKFNKPYRIFQSLVYLLSDALMSITAPEGLFFPFRHIFILKGGSFIPNGIPVNQISSAVAGLPMIVRTAPDEILLLFVGRLSPEKNIPLLLHGLQRLSGEFRGLKLVICGEGPENDRLHKLADDLGIKDLVYFLGYQEDVFSIMKACDLLALPSFREGMGNALFEALAAGLPAIASRIPSLQYWFEKNGIVSLFDPYSVDEFAEFIRRELGRSEDEKKRRRNEALRFVRDLDVDVMVQQYTEFYLGLASHEQETR